MKQTKVGRTLKAVGILLALVLLVEFFILSPRIFGRFTNRDAEPSADTSFFAQADDEVQPLPSAEPSATPPPIVSHASSTPTKMPTPTLVQADTPTAEPEPTESAEVAQKEATPTPTEPPAKPTATPTPPITKTPLPNAFAVNSIIFQEQDDYWNAGPANIAMLLSYWGDKTTEQEVKEALSFVSDKHVTPAEIVTYVEENSDVNIMLRYGGSLDLLKQLIAAGFPVMVQRSFSLPGDVGWSGHYTLINGYNEQRNTFLTMDSYVGAFQVYGAEHIEETWRAFNYAFLVLYQSEREAELYGAIDEWANQRWSLQHALVKATEEAASLPGLKRYFALYNRGTTLTKLGRYEEAATAFDQAANTFTGLSDFEKPHRMTWYQPDLYEAYYQVGRYQQVIDSADTALELAGADVLEESLLWRGLARQAFGEEDSAEADIARAIELNPSLEQLLPEDG